jgi:hypothetical protein
MLPVLVRVQVASGSFYRNTGMEFHNLPRSHTSLRTCTSTTSRLLPFLRRIHAPITISSFRRRTHHKICSSIAVRERPDRSWRRSGLMPRIGQHILFVGSVEFKHKVCGPEISIRARSESLILANRPQQSALFACTQYYLVRY